MITHAHLQSAYCKPGPQHAKLAELTVQMARISGRVLGFCCIAPLLPVIALMLFVRTIEPEEPVTFSE